MDGGDRGKWPELPFCSRRCRLIDLGRWLGEGYRIPAEAEEEAPVEYDSEEPP
jgi:endogenous inhibitor of DNA gyrase (YacG/DUF329 family)